MIRETRTKSDCQLDATFDKVLPQPVLQVDKDGVNIWGSGQLQGLILLVVLPRNRFHNCPVDWLHAEVVIEVHLVFSRVVNVDKTEQEKPLFAVPLHSQPQLLLPFLWHAVDELLAP